MAVVENYRRVLAAPGAAAFCAARLPISMVSLSTVILLRQTTGSYSVAGAVAAAGGVATACGSLVTSRWADTAGQARMLRPAVVVHAAAFTALAFCALLRAPTWTLFATAVVAGFAWPQFGSLVRARWPRVLQGDAGERLHTAYSLESALDGVIWMSGPILVTALAVHVAPVAACLLSAALVLTGGLALAALPASQPPPHPRTTTALRPRLLSPALIVMVASLAGIGAVMGSVEVVTVAFARERGAPGATGATGWLLALWALAGLLAGLAYGAVHWRAPCGAACFGP